IIPAAADIGRKAAEQQGVPDRQPVQQEKPAAGAPDSSAGSSALPLAVAGAVAALLLVLRRRFRGGNSCPQRHRRRRPATTLPKIVALSPRIGSYAWLCGTSQMWSSVRLNVLTVASPSIIAATTSPFSASGCCRTATQSPSVMAKSIMESPTTCSKKRFPSPTISFG